MIYLAVFEEGGKFHKIKVRGKRPKNVINYYKKHYKHRHIGLSFKDGTMFYLVKDIPRMENGFLASNKHKVFYKQRYSHVVNLKVVPELKLSELTCFSPQ